MIQIYLSIIIKFTTMTQKNNMDITLILYFQSKHQLHVISEEPAATFIS